MAKKSSPQTKPIEQYDHKGTCRLNNPPAGLVSAATEPNYGTKPYSYDPHLDPQLQWAGKAEHTSFEVPTVSLHVHERIDPRTIIRAAKGSNGDHRQASLFEFSIENPPLREAVEFYRHRHNWSNRLVAGDSLLVMNSLLEKEGMAGKVQMVYIDPPYGIKYGSNFQPFVNKRDVKDRKDEDLTQEPEMIRAFRDTWELGIHSYLTYLRDRLLLARELLTESGSVFVQINSENCPFVRMILNEIFGPDNFIADIIFRKKSLPLGAKSLETMHDHILFYSKDKSKHKYRHIFNFFNKLTSHWKFTSLPDGQVKKIRSHEIKLNENIKETRYFRLFSLIAPSYNENTDFEYNFCGHNYPPPSKSCWVVDQVKLDRLKFANRLQKEGSSVSYRLYLDDFPYNKFTNLWLDVGVSYKKSYVVQTTEQVIERCLLMTTDPGDLVLDPTCGSGTTAYVAEKWGRRWITCDTSRVAITLAKQRLMTAAFDYYDLAHPEEGVGSGFVYKTVPHITLKSIANNPEIDAIHEKHRPKVEAALAALNAAAKTSYEEWEVPFDPDPAWPEAAQKAHKKFLAARQKRQTETDASIQKNAPQETLYDQPQVDRTKVRVTGPFTVEAVPAPTVEPLTGDTPAPLPADDSAARTGESLRQDEWRTELLATGIRGRSGQRIAFARLEPLGGTRWLHARGETADDTQQQVAVSFGPEHAALDARQVEMALKEAQRLVPRPEILVFAAFQFDPEAAKDIDETNWPGVTLLKVQMNTDLQTDDLKKKRSSNESFWLIGQPDVTLNLITEGPEAGTILLSVNGFDYYDTRKGTVDGGGPEKIAMWMLDTDYDGRSLFPRQVFFPMAGKDDGWAKLKKSLKAELDEEKIEAYRGTVSLPFKPGKKRRIAVKIIDDRGIESIVERELDVPGA
ncbi:site-specific DNA-methyltransferase [Methanoculleus sp. 10]|jgi:adenine-specific DNA-methyltransferase|uniref:site-specific DNA-methyltransferase n=1 Tax=Methanoculleus sp. 10 TaxID=430615 RepID=UPI0025F7159D|nr:site-specific DNA-methyltransferase [Methanoculleus sp. 10]